MNTILMLYDPVHWERAEWDEVPLLADWNGRTLSLRAGPRVPLPQAGREWPPVAVYAPDELTEEEFQDLYQAHRAHIPELGLHY